jgi:Zn-dependent peptidase ImmA (M78 family)
MKLLLAKIRQKVPDWNKRALTEQDFFRLCRSERPNVRVHAIPLRVPGFLIVVRGVPHICLDAKLPAVERLRAGFHELAHHYFHTSLSAYAVRFFKLRPNTKEEHEAEVFALTALIPDSLLKKILASEEYADDWGFAEDILRERSELFVRYSMN